MIQIAKLRYIALAITAAASSFAAPSLGAGPAQDPARTQDAPPPPVLEVRRTPPPPLEMATTRSEPEAQARADFRVRVTGAGAELWSGDLALEGYQGAELRLDLQQADSACGPSAGQRSSRRRTGLTFNLRHGGRRDGDPFAVTAQWTRPSADCALPGTRTVGIDTEISIPPRATRVIEGDGGLRIELVRQR